MAAPSSARTPAPAKPSAPLRLLIISGYGTFGGRLAQLLADEPRLHLLIAGRSLDKARAFCDALAPGAGCEPLAFDRAGDLPAQLAAAAPDIVVDASGPFQDYGDDPYALVRAVIAQGADYLDLADGADFVAGIGAFDAEAKAKGVVALSGVSSFPVLTAAVIRELTPDWRRVEHIEAGIAPSPYAGVGPNVIAAIASYAGKKIALRRDGRDAHGRALSETLRYTIAPPGRLPLHNLHYSLVEVPDLRLLPPLWPQLKSIWIGVAPVPEILHYALNAMAWLVRLGLLRSLSPFAPLFHAAINQLRWGEHRGGMYVAVSGTDAAGAPAARSWHMLAEGDHGPLIPSMAVEALIRKRLTGSWPAPGARVASQALEFADYAALFARRAIVWGIRDDRPAPDASLYRRVLGDALETLPSAIQRMHKSDTARASGKAQVERGGNPLANLVADIVGFPKAAAEVDVAVTFTREREREIWQRNFGGRVFKSEQYRGSGRHDGLLTERFGPFRFGLALVVAEDRLNLVIRRWSAFGLPMPGFLAPRNESFERVEDGLFRFHVDIGLPLIGRLVRYRGWLVPDAPTPPR